MPRTHKRRNASAPRHAARSLACGVISSITVAVTNLSAHAASATWAAAPASNLWHSATNWSPATIPNSILETATFASSSITGVSVNDYTELSSLIFNAGANAYTISLDAGLTIASNGVINNSGQTQNFHVKTTAMTIQGTGSAGASTIYTLTSGADIARLYFYDTTTAGNAVFNMDGAQASGLAGGLLNFISNSTAGTATITNKPSTVSDPILPATTYFADSSSALNATIINQGATVGAAGATRFSQSATAASANITNHGGTAADMPGAITYFTSTSTAATATITNHGGTATNAVGGLTYFQLDATAGSALITANGASSGGLGATILFANNSTAGSATLIANGAAGTSGGEIKFRDFSTGSTATVQVNGTGKLNISEHSGAVGIGSLAGNGLVTLGLNTLVVGANNQSTVFSGGISGPGALTKLGTGALTLSGSNTYSAVTGIQAGTLIVNGSLYSSGLVTLTGGTLGGSGSVGNINGGTGGHILHPSVQLPATATTTLSLNSLSTSADTTLKFNLGTAGASDRLAISGSVSLAGGTLDVSNHATGPASLGYFKIMSYGSISGLNTINVPANANNVNYFLTSTRIPGFVEVHRGFLGDANDSGFVDLTDLTILAGKWQQTGAWEHGDFNKSGFIDLTDLTILAGHWQTGITAFAAAASSLDAPDSFHTAVASLLSGANPIPEPATLTLFTIATPLLLLRRIRTASSSRRNLP